MFASIHPASFKLHDVELSIVRADIRLYFEISLQNIAHRPPQWPPEGALEALTDRAGGLFIYAATIVKYIAALRVNPVTRLKTILDNTHSSGGSTYRQLDGVYNHILRTAIPEDLECGEAEAAILRLRTLLGVLVELQTPMSVPGLAELLREEEHILRGDLDAISAIILLPDVDCDGVVQLFHASFPDYLADLSRCTEYGGRLAIQPQESQNYLAIRITHMTEPNTNAQSETTGYVNQFWEYHYERASLETLEEISRILRQRLGQLSPNWPSYLILVDRILRVLLVAYEQGGDSTKLEDWIELGRHSLQLCEGDHLLRSHMMMKSAHGLLMRYRKLGGEAELNEAIEMYREALLLFPPDNPGRDTALNNLADALHARYSNSCDPATLAEIIALNREALSLSPPGHPGRDYSLAHLSFSLCHKYDASKDVAQLTEAVVLLRECLRLRPRGHPRRDVPLNGLGTTLKMLYRHSGDTAYLKEATTLLNDGLTYQPLGHPNRYLTLFELGKCHWEWYLQSQNPGELEITSALCQESLSLYPLGDPSRLFALGLASQTLTVQHKLTKKADQLRKAIAFARECESLCPEGHHHRNYALSVLIGILNHVAAESDDQQVMDELQRLRDEQEASLAPST
jgi:tetratricopeptide (TPR) repeat protein